MVEKSEDTPPSPRRAPWALIYERWRDGESAAQLAPVYNLAESTVHERCRWIDNAFPPDAPARLRHRFADRLRRVEAALDRGEPLEAERRAKALTALIRAARALQDWSEPERAAPAAKEARSEPVDAKLALKRALLDRFKRDRDQETGRSGVEGGLR
ncbi:MAG: hypothetical protein ACLFQ5_05065 [Oceanicaulis sp.]